MTCAVAPRIGASEVSRVRVIIATPTSGLDGLKDRIREVTEQLLASLEEREHMASEF